MYSLRSKQRLPVLASSAYTIGKLVLDKSNRYLTQRGICQQPNGLCNLRNVTMCKNAATQ